MDKIEVFGKSLNKPRGLSGGDAPIPEPFGGIPSGVFAIFAVVILTLSIATYMPEEDQQNNYPSTLTSSQSTYLENILSDRSRSSPTLSSYDTCGFLEMDLKEHLKEEMRVTLGTGYYGGGGWFIDDAIMVEDAVMEMDGASPTADSAPNSGGSPKNSPGGEQGVDFSGTNNQEQGVDEADFVKTDGSFVYMLNKGYSDYGIYPSGKLHILDIPEAGNISYLSNISIEGRPTEMLLVDDKAVVYSNVQIYSYYDEKHILDDVVKEERKVSNSVGSTQSSAESDEGIESSDDFEEIFDYGYYYRTTSFTKLTVLDLTNRSLPEVTKELYIEGSYQTARESEATVRMVSYGWMEIDGLKTWLDFSDYRTYWDLDWDSPKREQIWMEVMNETIEYNDKVIDQTPLDNLLPRIHEKSGEEIITHKYTESE